MIYLGHKEIRTCSGALSAEHFDAQDKINSVMRNILAEIDHHGVCAYRVHVVNDRPNIDVLPWCGFFHSGD
jgi:hypothetical protein